MMSWKMMVPNMILDMSGIHGHMKTQTKKEMIGKYFYCYQAEEIECRE